MSSKMANGKGKKITLEDALVPVEEQPYEVPGNWCWTRLEYLIQTSKEKTDEFDDLSVRYIGLENIEKDGGITGYSSVENVKSMKNIFHKRQILYGKLRPYLNKHDIASFEGVCSTDILVFDTLCSSNNKYINFYFNQPYFIDYVVGNSKGINLPRVSENVILNASVPLPPLLEQQRIVEQIERLFSKLDEAKNIAEETFNTFESVQKSVLYDAFTGKLTAKWRKNNGRSFKSWKNYTIQEVCTMKITDGTHKTPTYCNKEEGGVPFISSKDVTMKKICWDNIKYITPELHNELYARLAPQIDDILLAKNGTTGVAAIVEEDKVFDIYVTLALLRPDKTIINPRYLLNIVNSPICKEQFDEYLTGIGVPNLHLRDIKQVCIRVPELDEQEEIVRLVGYVIDKEQKAAEVIKNVIQMVDLMKKSILAKAFRGELGTNNPQEESAVELLENYIKQ